MDEVIDAKMLIKRHLSTIEELRREYMTYLSLQKVSCAPDAYNELLEDLETFAENHKEKIKGIINGKY